MRAALRPIVCDPTAIQKAPVSPPFFQLRDVPPSTDRQHATVSTHLNYNSVPHNHTAAAAPVTHLLFEQLCNIRHGPIQLHRLIGKRQEAFALVEPARLLILGIHDDSE
jgi:hypothetical protein